MTSAKTSSEVGNDTEMARQLASGEWKFTKQVRLSTGESDRSSRVRNDEKLYAFIAYTSKNMLKIWIKELKRQVHSEPWTISA